MTLVPQGAALSDSSERTRVLLQDLWQRNRPTIEARLAIVDCAAAASPIPGELRAEARDVAHKLSGSLGMFGFDEGTLLARELEQLLEQPEPDASRLAELAHQLRTMLLSAS